MVCARGNGRKVKGKTQHKGVHLTPTQRAWVEGLLASETISVEIKLEISIIQAKFKEKFGRDIKPYTISRIRKSVAAPPK
jgi:hypothetical protein